MYLNKAIDPKVEFEIQDRSIEYERRRKDCQKRRWHSNHHPPPQRIARRDYRYSLGIRGLLLLVTGKIRLENERYCGRAQNLDITTT